MNWDLVVFDEYHFGAGEMTAKELFEGEEDAVAKKLVKLEYASGLEEVNEDLTVLSQTETEFLPITTKAYLYLSGTPFKALATGNSSKSRSSTGPTPTNSVRRKSSPQDTPAAGTPTARCRKCAFSRIKCRTNWWRSQRRASSMSSTSTSSFRPPAPAPSRDFKHKSDVQKWLDIIRGQYAPKAVESLKTGTRPPFPYSDARLLPYLQHSFWFLPNVAACRAMANLWPKGTTPSGAHTR